MLLVQTALGQSASVVEDTSDPTHPRPICTLSGYANPTFISSETIGYAFNHGENEILTSPTVIATASLLSQGVTHVAGVTGYVGAFAWSPGGGMLAYSVTSYSSLGSGQSSQAWIKRGAAAAAALTPPLPIFGRDGSMHDQRYDAFSADGKYLAIIDTTAGDASNTNRDLAYFQVRAVADGSLVWFPAEGLASLGKGPGAATMGIWSTAGDTLFYSDSAGVEAWDPQTGTRTLLPNVRWEHPSISADGRFLAYTVVDSQLRPHIEVHDLQLGTTRVFPPAMRSASFFLTDTLLLEVENTENTVGPGPPFFPDGKVYAVDLSSGVETLMPFAAALDQWPR